MRSREVPITADDANITSFQLSQGLKILPVIKPVAAALIDVLYISGVTTSKPFHTNVVAQLNAADTRIT